MIKTILIGGLAVSLLCIFFSTTGRNRLRILTNRRPSTRYGPPGVRNGETSTEPYFRIIIASTTPRIKVTTHSNVNLTEHLELNDNKEKTPSVQSVTEALISVSLEVPDLVTFPNASVEVITEQSNLDNNPKLDIKTSLPLNESTGVLNSSEPGGFRDTVPEKVEAATELYNDYSMSNKINENPKNLVSMLSSTINYDIISSKASAEEVEIRGKNLPIISTVVTESTTVKSQTLSDLEKITESNIDSQGINISAAPNRANPFDVFNITLTYENATETLVNNKNPSTTTTQSSILEIPKNTSFKAGTTDIFKSGPPISFEIENQALRSRYLPPSAAAPALEYNRMRTLLQNSRIDSSVIEKSIEPPSRHYLPPKANSHLTSFQYQ